MVYFILPTVYLIVGILLYLKPDPKINSIYGFRTKISSVNEHTWKYCNKLCGKMLFYIGIVSAILVLTVNSVEIKVFGLFTLAEIIHIFMMILILSLIPIINHRCKKKFPEYYK